MQKRKLSWSLGTAAKLPDCSLMVGTDQSGGNNSQNSKTLIMFPSLQVRCKIHPLIMLLVILTFRKVKMSAVSKALWNITYCNKCAKSVLSSCDVWNLWLSVMASLIPYLSFYSAANLMKGAGGDRISFHYNALHTLVLSMHKHTDNTDRLNLFYSPHLSQTHTHTHTNTFD